MTTKTVRIKPVGHVTIRRTGRTVTVEAFNRGTLVSETCETTAHAEALFNNTVRTWQGAAIRGVMPAEAREALALLD